MPPSRSFSLEEGMILPEFNSIFFGAFVFIILTESKKSKAMVPIQDWDELLSFYSSLVWISIVASDKRNLTSLHHASMILYHRECDYGSTHCKSVVKTGLSFLLKAGVKS